MLKEFAFKKFGDDFARMLANSESVARFRRTTSKGYFSRYVSDSLAFEKLPRSELRGNQPAEIKNPGAGRPGGGGDANEPLLYESAERQFF